MNLSILKIQIKLQGKIRVHHDDEVTELAWKESNGRSKKCYSIKDGSTKEISSCRSWVQL